MGRATGRNNKELGALQLMQGLLGTLGSAGRGLVAGTAGLPGDIESLVRLLPGFDEKTILPTTEEVSKALPQLPPNFRQPVAEGMGQMGAMTPGQVAKLGKAGKQGALALIDRAMTPSRVAQAGAIKPRGGNWLVDGGLSPKEELYQFHTTLAEPENASAFERIMNNGREVPMTPEELNQRRGNYQAVNDWIKGPLTKYFKRDFASETDPVRELFDQGIKHTDVGNMVNPLEYDMRQLSYYGKDARNRASWAYPEDGFEPRLMAKTADGRAWENIADSMVQAVNKNDVKLPQRLANPWLDKLGDKDVVHQLSDGFYDTDMGIPNIMTAFHDAMAAGKLRPEQLQQMSMEKAVRFTNDHRVAKELEKAQQRERLMKNTMMHHGETLKEYPEGYKWVDLKLPKEGTVDPASVRQNPDGTWSPIDAEGNVMQRIEVHGMDPVDVVENSPERAHLGGQLGAEGMLMEHCVGGYCDDVANGRTRVMSLRNTQTGQPHVTLETSPPPVDIHGGPNEDDYNTLWEQAFEKFGPDSDGTPEFLEYVENGLKDLRKGEPWQVHQVKGGANSRPKDEYQPFISDFFKTNPHEFEGDIGNTNLRAWDDISTGDDFTVKEMHQLRQAGHLENMPRYLDNADVEALRGKLGGIPDQGQPPEVTKMIDDLVNGEPQQFAAGGLVTSPMDDDFSLPGHF